MLAALSTIIYLFFEEYFINIYTRLYLHFCVAATNYYLELIKHFGCGTCICLSLHFTGRSFGCIVHYHKPCTSKVYTRNTKASRDAS